MLNLLISPIAELAGTWLKGKVDKSKADSEVKVARAKAEAKVYETEATSSMLNEKNLTDQMGDSIKDEIWTIWFVLVLTSEGGIYAVSQFRSGFYYIAKDMNIPYVPIEIDFKNRSFNIQKPHFITGSFEEESLKLEELFEGVEGATRTFTMLREKE